MDTTHYVQLALLRLADGDQAARDELFQRAHDRVRQLVSRCLHRDFARLAALEQTDDVLQDVYLRLLKGWDRLIQDEQGNAVREPAVFLSRVSRLIREVLLDSVRHHHGRTGYRPQARSLATDDEQAPAFDPGSDTHNPEALAMLNDFHHRVETLPDLLRQVVDLHWYQDLSHPEVAALLGLGESTVRKYWVQARLKLIEQLGQNPFAE